MSLIRTLLGLTALVCVVLASGGSALAEGPLVAPPLSTPVSSGCKEGYVFNSGPWFEGGAIRIGGQRAVVKLTLLALPGAGHYAVWIRMDDATPFTIDAPKGGESFTLVFTELRPGRHILLFATLKEQADGSVSVFRKNEQCFTLPDGRDA